jgi:MFS family permease
MKQSVVSYRGRNLPPADNDTVTPIPRKPWFAVLSMVAATFFSEVVIIPFVPFLVAKLFPGLEKTEFGTRAGFLDGAYYLGVVIGGPIWGKLADVLGRKVAMLWGLFAGVCFAVAFGFSDNYELALGIRLVWGMSGANMSIARTILAEISDHTNRARAFTALGLGILLGRLLGNGIGGLLSEPADKYSFLDIEFFRLYPFSLPVFVASVLNMISMVIGVLYIPETKQKSQNPGSLAERLLSPTKQKTPNHSGICDILKQPKSLALLLSSCFVSLTHAIYNVVFTLWVLNDIHDYGFNFGTSEIGLVRVFAIPTDLLLQLVLWPYSVKKFGLFSCYRICALLWAMAVIVTPCASYVNRSPLAVQWTVLELCVIFNNILASVVLSGGGILSTNFTQKKIRGQFLGIRQSFIGLGRGLGSCFGGIIFAWSLQTDERSGILAQLPFNFYFVWLIQCLFMLVVFTLSFSFAGKELEMNPEERRLSQLVAEDKKKAREAAISLN